MLVLRVLTRVALAPAHPEVPGAVTTVDGEPAAQRDWLPGLAAVLCAQVSRRAGPARPAGFYCSPSAIHLPGSAIGSKPILA